MTQPSGTQRDAEAQRARQAQEYISKLELGLEAARGGHLSFNRAVLAFPHALRQEIYLREAGAGRLDVFGLLSYATRGMPPGMNESEMRRARDLVDRISGILIGRLSDMATDAMISGLGGLSGRSARFSALAPELQAAEINQAIEITRTVGNALNTGNQEPLRLLLTTSQLGVGAQEWARSSLDIVFDRDGRIGAEIERRAGGDRMMRRAFQSYLAFSPQERAEITRWLERGGTLNSETFGRLYAIVNGDVRGPAADILRALRMDYPIILAQTIQDISLQNIYDINMQLEAFRSRTRVA